MSKDEFSFGTFGVFGAFALGSLGFTIGTTYLM
jgi:hypothetical protein